MTFPFTLYEHLIYIHIHKYLHNTLLLEAALTVFIPEPWRGTSCTHLRLSIPPILTDPLKLGQTQIQALGEQQEFQIRPVIFLFQFPSFG